MEQQEDTFEYQVEQFADLQILRYRVPGFEKLLSLIHISEPTRPY